MFFYKRCKQGYAREHISTRPHGSSLSWEQITKFISKSVKHWQVNQWQIKK